MSQAIQLLDIVALLEDIPNSNLQRGQVGVIAKILSPEAIEVEFKDKEGQVYTTQALLSNQILRLLYSPKAEEVELENIKIKILRYLLQEMPQPISQPINHLKIAHALTTDPDEIDSALNELEQLDYVNLERLILMDVGHCLNVQILSKGRLVAKGKIPLESQEERPSINLDKVNQLIFGNQYIGGNNIDCQTNIEKP